MLPPRSNGRTNEMEYESMILISNENSPSQVLVENYSVLKMQPQCRVFKSKVDKSCTIVQRIPRDIVEPNATM
jgi:hypothetical protein